MTRPLLTLLVALLALLATGCGGDDGEDARAVLRATFADAEPVRSGVVDLALRVDAKGLQGLDEPVAVDLEGPFQSRGAGKVPAFDLDLALTTGGATLRTGATSTGERGWLKLEGRSYTLTDELFGRLEQSRQGSAQQDGKAGGLDLASFGVDPSRWLDDAEVVGEEQAGGVPATHVRGDVDVPRLLDDVGTLLDKAGPLGLAGAGQVPRKLTAEQREQVQEAVRTATVDVWSGRDDRRLRRLRVDVRFDVPEGDREGSVRLDLTFAELDREQPVEAPEDARPLRELQEGLGALAQAVQGASGQEAAPEDGATPAPAPAPAPDAGGGSAYEQCLAQAAGDLRAQQECAALLAG